MQTRIFSSMAEIPRSSWDNLTGNIDTPILEWNWLELLESSGSISEINGWSPRHLTLWDNNELVAGAPLYVRTDSWGDFVYDFGFSEAAFKLKFPWYPKLVGMCPVTPCVGWHVLTVPGFDAHELTILWLEEAIQLAKTLGVVSLQFNFVAPEWFQSWNYEKKRVGEWHSWIHQNYMFENPGFSDFDSYLELFDKNQRRNIKRERKKFADLGLTSKIVSGDDIPDSWFFLMGKLYEKTNDRFGPYAAKFLEPDFFTRLDKIRNLLVFSASMTDETDEPLALGFFLRKKNMLLGRYWGEREWRDNQYFNVCYYNPIEWAINQSIRFFDPGAGTFLKARRGFASKKNFSLHRFFDPRGEKLFTRFIPTINSRENEEIEALNAAVPFKQEAREPWKI